MTLKRNLLILLLLASIGSFNRFGTDIRFIDFTLVFVIGFFSALLIEILRKQFTDRA